MRSLLPFVLALPVLISACGGNPEAASADNLAAPTSAPTAAAPPAPVGADVDDTHAPPKPSELQTFRDWTVGCDNGLACRATALAPDNTVDATTLMSVDRAPGPDGAVTIRIVSREDVVSPVTVSVDGQAVVQGGTAAEEGAIVFTRQTARRIAAALANGLQLTVTGANSPPRAISLAGASAALRWMDVQQGRAGTRGALVAAGEKPDTAPTPPLPVIRAIAPRGEAALLDPTLLASMRRTAQCETERDMGEPEAHGLGGSTLVLLPCSTGAYNLMSAVFLVRNGKAVPAQFDAPVGISPEEQAVPNIVNATFEDGVLRSFAKGRGLGDCGVFTSEVWDGTRFRRSELSQLDDCRGSTEYITLWRARVVR